MTTLALDKFNALLSNDVENEKTAVNMSDLEQNKPYMMTEWREITYTKDGEERTQAIGTLEKDESEVWIPKSMLRKIEDKDGPYMFVYRGRKSDKWKTYKIDVVCGDVLRAKGIVSDKKNKTVKLPNL